jgi:cytosine/adenosine deaminase-related metal-dependent hydrolase
VVLSLRAVHLHPWGSAVGTIVNFATPADVDAVFVDGRPLKWGGELVGLDYEVLARRAEASRERLLEAAGFSMVDARAGGISPPIPPGF